MNNIRVTKVFSHAGWSITAEVEPGAELLPSAIFIFKNNGTTTLTDYQGVCSLAEFKRLRAFTGAVVPILGNAFVRTSQAKIALPPDAPTSKVDEVVSNLTAGCRALKLELQTLTSTTEIIPI